jgi:hypothetical protein
MSVAEIIDEPRPKLPAVRSEAPLPITYTEARAALERCERVDECAEWADRAGALASYARQARDRELEAMAKRITVGERPQDDLLEIEGPVWCRAVTATVLVVRSA